MRAVILNSGLGRRMGDITKHYPKCMTSLTNRDTILSRQLKMLEAAGIQDVIITTGYCDEALMDYCASLRSRLRLQFIHNELYATTNYIYSLYLAREHLNDDILLLHGDLVFSKEVLDMVYNAATSCMAVSQTLPLPEKDFKAVVFDAGGEDGRRRRPPGGGAA